LNKVLRYQFSLAGHFLSPFVFGEKNVLHIFHYIFVVFKSFVHFCKAIIY